MTVKYLFKGLIIICLLFGLHGITDAQNDSLRLKIDAIIKSKQATIGVGILPFEDGDTLIINGDKHFPMQSVYKFHLALAILDLVDKGKLSFNQMVRINKKDLRKNTWSPIREKYPEGNVEISLSDLIKYTVSQSDNNGCDILFRLVGGTDKANEYIHKLGISDVCISATEAEMSKNWDVQYTNWCTPLSAIQLLDKFYRKAILSKKSGDFLYQIMIETSTGIKRIKGLLPENAIVAHKPGTSGSNEQGISAATNDIGIVTLPNGKQYAIAVFVSDSKEDYENNEIIIAMISRVTWDYFLIKYKIKHDKRSTN